MMNLQESVRSVNNEYPHLHLTIQPHNGTECSLSFEGECKDTWESHMKLHIQNGILSFLPVKPKWNFWRIIGLRLKVTIGKIEFSTFPYPVIRATLQVPKNTLQHVDMSGESELDMGPVSDHVKLSLREYSYADICGISSLSARVFGCSELEVRDVAAFDATLRSDSSCHIYGDHYQMIRLLMEEECECKVEVGTVDFLQFKHSPSASLDIKARVKQILNENPTAAPILP